ncbi:hypothetical protein ACFW04_014033 [Cataglyphis niger]
MISLLSNQHLSTFLNILNSIFEEEAFPESWQHSSKNNFIPSRQFGFKKKKSCHDNLGIFLLDIYNGFALNKSTACLFLDVVGTFEFGLPPKLCQFVYNLIHLRKLQLIINGDISNTLFSFKGVPQSSILNSSKSHLILNGMVIHIDTLSKKCIKLLNILKCLRGVWWGVNPNLLLSIYKSLVRGSMEYSFLYIRINNCTQLEKLEKIQRKALRLCLGLRQSIPFNVIHAESALLLIINHRQLYDLQISFFNNKQFDILSNFIFYNAFLKFKPYESKIASFDFLPVYMHDFDFSPTSIDIHITQCFYTDVFKTDFSDYVGFVFYSPISHTQHLYKIDDHASIFTGETFVLLKCLDFILSNQFSNSTIFTDSRSLTKTISYSISKTANLSNLTIYIIWISNHSGILGNEIADLLTKSAFRFLIRVHPDTQKSFRFLPNAPAGLSSETFKLLSFHLELSTEMPRDRVVATRVTRFFRSIENARHQQTTSPFSKDPS